MPRLLREVAIFLAFLALAAVRSSLTSGLSTHLFAGADPTQDTWLLNWITLNLVRHPGAVFQGNNFFPSRDAVLLCDPLLGPAALVLPLRLVTSNPVFLYNAAVLLVLSLGSYGFYLLARRLGASTGAALLAGVAIPYLPSQLHHLDHLNLLTLTGFPFLLMALLELLQRPRPAAALATAVAFAFQAGTSGYWAFSAALLCLLVAACHLPRFRDPRTWLWSLSAAAFAALLLAPYVLGFLGHRSQADMARNVEVNATYSTDLALGLFFANSYLWRGVMRGGAMSLFPGVVVFALGVYGLVRAPRHTRLLLLGIALPFFVLSLGPELRAFKQPLGPAPFRLLFDHVPLFNAGRHPVTFAVPAVMCLGLAAAIGFDATGLARRPLAVALVLAASIAETWAPCPPREPKSLALPEAYVFLQSQPRGGILELPVEYGSRSQWWSIFHGLPIVNGMSAYQPAWYENMIHLIRDEWSDRPARQDMQHWRSLRYLKGHVPLRYLLVHPDTNGYTRTHLASTPGTFELLHTSPEGIEIYRVRSSGEGRVLRRRFRDDQLRGGLYARVRAPRGARLVARLNDRELDRRALSGEWEDVTWPLRGAPIRRGLNVVELSLEPEGALQLASIEPATEALPERAQSTLRRPPGEGRVAVLDARGP